MSFTIRPIRPEDMETARWVIGTVSGELGSDDGASTPKQKPKAGSYLADLQDVTGRYFDKGGVFNVMTDRDRVVGTGAVQCITETTCELKQLWLLSAYRGRGLGFEMALQLIEWAKDNQYQTMRLEALQTQVEALKLFRKLGFKPVEPYQEGQPQLFMELNLLKFHSTY